MSCGSKNNNVRLSPALTHSVRLILLSGALVSTASWSQTTEQTLRTIKATADDEEGIKASEQEGATKSSLSIRETPQSITVITLESLEDRQVRDLTTALELTAGVTVAGGSTTGGPFAGRGLATGESFVIRGQEINDNRDIRIDGFAVPTRSFDMAAFERVEVIKGPSSMLYGQGSLGGFINLVRKKPKQEFESSVAAQVGSWNTYRIEGDITGALGKDSPLAGRLIASLDDGESFIEGVETRVATVSPSLQWDIGESTRASVEVMYQEEVFTPSHGIPLRPVGDHRLQIPSVSRTKFIGLPAEKESTSEDLLGTARLEQQISDNWLATLLLHKSDQEFNRYFDSYAHGGLDVPSNDPDPTAPGDTYMYADRASIERDNWAGELRVNGQFELFNREHSLLIGVERNSREERVAFGYDQIGLSNIYTGDFSALGTVPGGAGGMEFDRDFGSVSNNKALFAQAGIAVADRTRILLGARYDEAKQEAISYPSGEYTDRKTDDEITFRVGVTQDLSENITVYANYAESFNPVSDVSCEGEILDPETGRGFELGAKSEWFDRRFGVTTAVFRQELLKSPVPDPVNRNCMVNGGEEITEGVELEFTGSPIEGWKLGGAISWLDSEYNEPEGEGSRFGMKPYAIVEDQFSLFTSYELQGGALRGLGFGITYVNIGDRYLGYSGMSDWTDGTSDDYAWLDGYDRVDASVFYNGFENIEVSLQVRNALDERYIEHFRDIESNNYFGAPTAYLLRAKFTF